MLELSTKLTLSQKLLLEPNLTHYFPPEDLEKIGDFVFSGYTADEQSREAWKRRNEAGMDLAMQMQKAKTFPWPNCSNVAFPLVTIGALQFHARAYPLLVNGPNLVQARVRGPDPTGTYTTSAVKLSKHMSWQLLEENESWEEDTDKALLHAAIVGAAFKKTYYNSGLQQNSSQFVLPKDLVFDYWAKSVEECGRKTHRIPFYRNEIYENVKREIFADILQEPWYSADSSPAENSSTVESDRRAGLTPSTSSALTPFIFLEQHCHLDLDQDGYAEPYIITIEESSKAVVRITTNFDRMEDIERTPSGEVIRINGTEYFTQIPMIPSPDGGVLGIGFGVLLGSLNESVNSAINQLFDAGTLATTAGGFLGRGANIRGGVLSFSPFSWNRVDASGDDLRKNLLPLPVREPSNVLFQLLGLLIEYTGRVSGATDVQVGINPGQNTPAETSRSLVEQGQKVYAAIFKRIWRAFKKEFKKLYILNAKFLEPTPFGEETISRDDYKEGSFYISPAADPNIVSDVARLGQAQMLRIAARETPGYNTELVERFYLQALQIPAPEAFFPGIDPEAPVQPSEKLQIAQLNAQIEMAKIENSKLLLAATLQEQQALNIAKISELSAKTLKYQEEAKGVSQTQAISAANAAIGAMKAHNSQLDERLKSLLSGIENESARTTKPGAVGGVEKTANQ